MNYTKALKIIRDKKRWSQAEFGDYLGIGQNSVSEYENGNRIPHRDIKDKISQLINNDKDLTEFKDTEIEYEKPRPKTENEFIGEKINIVGSLQVTAEEYISLRESLAAAKVTAEIMRDQNDKIIAILTTEYSKHHSIELTK